MEQKTQTSSGPKDFFMHLLAFATLYVSAVSFISLWFQYINIKFPDALNQYYSYGYDQLRWPIAVLVVVFPVFLLLARWISNGIAGDSIRKELRIYKWLVYLTLFASAVTVIVDLVTLIYNFLGGELTSRFGLKVLVVLVVALAIFGYYLWHLRSDISQTKKKRAIFSWIALIAVVGSIVLGFALVGSPSTARAQKFDQQRINDLQNIQWQVVSYWQNKDRVPSSLDEIDDGIRGYVIPVDPRTGETYEYKALSGLNFEICANFELKNDLDKNWVHDSGRVCFIKTIDPELYPKPLPVR